MRRRYEVSAWNNTVPLELNWMNYSKKSGLSKNKLSHKAEMQRSQINHYCNNEVVRLDTDIPARICTVFDCKIEDLLEFVPPEKK